MADYNSLYTVPEIDESIGRVLNNEVGGMVLIPNAVLSLEKGDSSSDILSAFGGEEAFKNICKKVSKGIPPYFGSSSDKTIDVRTSCFNFNATVDEDANQYVLEIVSSSNPKQTNDTSVTKRFSLSAGSMSLTSDYLSDFNLANIYYVLGDLTNITTKSSHSQIIEYLDLDSSFNSVKLLALRARDSSLTIVSEGNESTRTSIWNVKSSYTNDSNWVLNTSSSYPFEDDQNILVVRRLVIQCTNNTLSCTNNESTTYQRNRVRGSLSIGSAGFYNILRCPLNVSENTCSGMVTIVQRLANQSANFLTFYFNVNNNALNVKVLSHNNIGALPALAYTYNSNEGYLAVQITTTGTFYYEVSVALETNCYLLSDNDILKPYSNLGNQSIVNF